MAMINEKGVAARYLQSQKKRSILMIFGIVLAIALISTLFSMLNVVQKYEITTESANGIWHVEAIHCTPEQATALSRRIDVTDSGRVVRLDKSVLIGGEITGSLTGCGTGGAGQMNFTLASGSFPSKDNEIALEGWALKKLNPKAVAGDTVSVRLSDGIETNFVVSGILKDVSQHKADEHTAAAVTIRRAQQLTHTSSVNVLMQVKNGVNINSFVKSVKESEHVGSVIQHTRLLAALGRSDNQNAISIYMAGGFLALLVIFSAVMMIFNAFNISVTQRIRQFGLLRAMGATPKQIRKMVRSEALFLSFLGVIPGLLLGIITTNILIAFLRTFAPEIFPPEGPAVYISPVALLTGAAIGILTTFISSLLPARKAGRISPVEAMSSASSQRIKKKSAKGIATRFIPVEAALSLRRLLCRKRAFVLTSLSLSFGILLLLCFSPLMTMLSEGTSTTFDLGDVYVAAKKPDTGISGQLVTSLSKISGIEKVSPKRIASVNATFSYGMLGNDYADGLKSGQWKKAQKGGNGMVLPTGQSTIIGIPDDDINALGSRLVFGRSDAGQINSRNGVILTLNTMSRNSLNIGDLRPGEFITIGKQKFMICGIVKNDALMYSYSESFIGMYTTNSVLNKITNQPVNTLSMTIRHDANSDMVFGQIKTLVSGDAGLQIGDLRDSSSMVSRMMIVGNVFIYGFIAVIALIGILNIINTMSTNIIVRTREIGLLRASGMTMNQVTAMVLGESALYGALALVIGLAAGIPLERQIYTMMVKNTYAIPWGIPWTIVTVASAVTLAAVLLSVISPLRHIKKIEITEAVTVE